MWISGLQGLTEIRDNAKPLNAQLLKPTAMKYTFRTILKYNLPKLIRKAVLPFQLEGLLYSDSFPV